MDPNIDDRSVYSDYMYSRTERQTAVAQLDELKRYLQASGFLDDNAKRLIQNTSDALSRQNSALDGFLACIPVEDRRSPCSQAVLDQVFGTPELLENVLHFLPLHDALKAQQVNKAFYLSIKDSPRIQRNLGFLADEDSDLRIPVPLTTPNIYFFVDDLTEGLQLTDDNCVSLSGDIFNGVERLPRLGSKSRQLLICQPPIQTLNIFSDCCYGHFPLVTAEQRPTLSLTSATGVTLGEVIDAARTLATDHKTCPNAPISMHDEHGFVKCSLYLSARITLREGDPRLVKKRHRREQETRATDRTRGLGARLGPYITAKQAARANGQHIPTLAEFERQQENDST